MLIATYILLVSHAIVSTYLNMIPAITNVICHSINSFKSSLNIILILSSCTLTEMAADLSEIHYSALKSQSSVALLIKYILTYLKSLFYLCFKQMRHVH